MKKIIDLFIVPKDGKVSEKTLTANLLACVVGILISLSLLATTTWAWFTGSVTSSENVIKGAGSTITVQRSGSDQDETFEVTSSGKYTITFEEGVDYIITLTNEGTARSGYCDLVVDEVRYLTEQIHTDTYVAETDDPYDINMISFGLTFDRQVTLTLTTYWGLTGVSERAFCNGGAYAYDSATMSFVEVTP